MTDFEEVDLRKAYTMITSPAVVATKGAGVYNLTPYGWIMPMDYDPHGKLTYPFEIKLKLFKSIDSAFEDWKEKVFF